MATTAIPGARQRNGMSVAFLVFTFLALLLVLGPALWLLIGVVGRAVPHFSWSVLYTDTNGATGGLANAILGTLVLMLGTLILAGSVGVLAGIHLAELSKPRKSGKASGGFLRIASDVLSGFPSIVLGYVGYVALVVFLHWGFSLLPAVIILSIMVVPYIAKTTETAIRQVPTNYREGAEALGMSTGYSLRKVILKTAFPGIVTGLLLAIAIAGGETAPLIYTAGFSDQNPSFSLLHHQIGYLTYPVFNFYNLPKTQSHYLAYDAALLLIILVLILIVVAHFIVARTQRHAEGRTL